MAGHQGGLHPQGGYRTADLPKEKEPKEPLTPLQKAIGVLFIAPIATAVFAGLVTLCAKFIMICMAWIS